MIGLCLLLVLVGLTVSLPATAAARALGRRTRALDGPGVTGQVKPAARSVPNTGGIAIFLAVAVPMVAGLVAVRLGKVEWVMRMVPALREHLARIAGDLGPGLGLAAGMLALHVLGTIDDRRAMGPWVKLAAMAAVSGAVVWLTQTRLLTLLDTPAGGPWLSVAITVLWFVAVTNAMNFLDNMDGLAAGVGVIASGFFLVAALLNKQWFVGSVLALLIGGLLGFLAFNFPFTKRGASIFMGDGGSLVLGFLLAFLTARTTYYDEAHGGGRLGGGWYAVFMPVVVLAVPLYDFATVVAIRAWRGRSPVVGDLNHLSHRLVRRGLSRRAAVLVIYGFTAVTAIGGVSLGSLQGWQAVLVGVQTGLVLMVLGIEEWASARATRAADGGGAEGRR